jgi:subtilisin family serine protease
MKVTVSKYLNVRVGSPSVNAPCYQYLSPGSELIVDGILYKGDLYDGIDTWLKDEAGNYYWSGGVNMKPVSNITISYPDYLKDFAWISNKGKGVVIAIIDTGVMMNQDYYDCSLIRQINLADDNDELDHGNFICGILAGKGPVFGISGNAEILSVKYHSNTFNEIGGRIKNLISALKTVLALNSPVIINFSQGFYDFQLTDLSAEKDEIVTLIKSIEAKGNSVMICSAGDNKDINDHIFPASLASCISVGTIDYDHKNMEITGKLDILAPLVNFTSYNNKFDVIRAPGSSFTTAVISGIVASFVSSLKGKKFAKADIMNELSKFSTGLNSFEFDNLSKIQYHIS